MKDAPHSFYFSFIWKISVVKLYIEFNSFWISNLSKEVIHDMVNVYAININFVISSTTWTDLLYNISEERTAKINRYYFEKDRKYSLFAELILKYALLKEYNLKDKSIKFEYNPYGKPFLKDYPHIHFNLSHSGDWVVCALSKTEVGIDIEKIDILPMQVAKSILTERELDYLSLGAEDPKELFYKYWTLKESYVKAVGEGIHIPFQTFEFLFDNEIHFYSDSIPMNQYGFLSYKIDQMHRISICTMADQSPQSMKYLQKFVSPEQIIRFSLEALYTV
jgi:4'-phosphopantetheinyl transferase